ncbi:ATP-dependent DNA helicase [Legionella longbeachae]|uniref:DNA 5'-3' helicase n=1 Tax=Legionella longbeachae serogroup 1 (strain NSW150) TaxID=661367 RepID=D3HRQ7_LEGLN|nr:ATP-dependent DNA helicase [Legionella longbeachae]VEE02090.1 ATP-dependent helicase [Legionella oakridgensis]HBD7396663.1 ATP-dependent DNA helicase [Legionella pneumophila]ARB91607.1 ATP-dependent DNA helicase [Legionella longbeachae]ARM35248.1 ATP-dependent DNA helicase [Legionella longbeachae]EEZ95295.1 putative ATP-dependent helicase [Legionella longbeachae D-4968]
MVEITSLIQSCKRALGEKGRLSTAIPGFIARAPQSDLAVAIAAAIEEKSILVAEAGTGTGKTFAYLLPSLLSGKKTLISTATKTLQDQLYQKDLPTLVRALGLSVRVQNLKGRANYICEYRVALYSEEGQFQTPQCAHEVAHVRSKLSQMKNGDRSELPELSEDSPVWPYVTSTVDNCLGVECPHHETCFLVKARKRALEADVVVINHHLFFADSRLKEEGFGELLPGVDVVIFDEAHQLAEIATHFNGERIGTRQFRDLLDDLIKEWPVLDLANQPLKVLSHKADKLMDELLISLPAEERVSWEEIKRNKTFLDIWSRWLALKDELLECFNKISLSEFPGVARCKERLVDFARILLIFTEETNDKIRWLERFKHTLVFHATPYDVAKSFSELLKRQSCTYVFTSATLTMADSFDCFCKPLGLDGVQTLVLPSPFDYQQQALLYFPRGLPDPKNITYNELLIKRAIPLIEALGGRSFFLFTSHKSLKQVAQIISSNLNYPLLIQGTEAKPILLERFRQLGNAVLLGTSTFWEGVDVKGEALSCVIIDKIPFSSPVDPVIRGKMSYLKEKGLSGFDELSLPSAVIALKQGVGRLIRDNTDKGVLMIADPRLTGREYGRRILASLPQLPKTRDEQRVLQFIRELELTNEAISD